MSVSLKDLTPQQRAALRRELEHEDAEEGRPAVSELLFTCPGVRAYDDQGAETIVPCSQDGGSPFRSPTLAGVCPEHGVHVS